jgi:hypothetical protein
MRSTNAARAAWLYAPACVFAVVPVLMAAKVYHASVPVSATEFAYLLLPPLACTALFTGVLGALPGSDRAKASGAAFGIVLLNAYPTIAERLGVIPGSAEDVILGLAYLSGLAAVLFALVSKRPELFEALDTLPKIGAVLFVAYIAWWATVRWRAPFDRDGARLVGAPVTLPPGGDTPDIVHLVFDGLGRLDWLARDYQIDGSRLAGRLESAGIRINRTAVANYSQTYLSIGSTLAMGYVNDLAAEVKPIHARRAAAAVIEHAPVVRALVARGYRFTLMSSGYEALADHSAAHDGVRGPTWFGQLQAYVVPYTPFRLLPLQALSHVPHRRRTLRLLEQLESFQPGERPRYVLAHVLAPHPPFVLGPRGETRTPARIFSIQDGSTFHGDREEYRRGFGEQARFILAWIERLAEKWSRLPRRPILIISGDHGPGLGYNMRNPEAGETDARMAVFLAIGGTRGPLPGSPVNIYRHVMTEAFGLQLPALPDRSFVSSWNEPFAFHEVRVSPPEETTRARSLWP